MDRFDKLSRFKDIDGNIFDSLAEYEDVINEVQDISLIFINGSWYADPIGLDREPLYMMHECLRKKTKDS